MASIALTLQSAMQKHAPLLQGVLTRSERRAVESFIQDPGFDSEPTFKQSYAPQSGEIFGILNALTTSLSGPPLATVPLIMAVVE